MNCIRWTCLSVWSALCWSSTELSNASFHKGFKCTWLCCQMKLVGKPWQTAEITLLRLSNSGNNDHNRNHIHYIVKASLSVIISNINTVPPQHQYSSIKKPISFIVKIVIFPVFWWHRSQKEKLYCDRSFLTLFLNQRVIWKIHAIERISAVECRICKMLFFFFFVSDRFWNESLNIDYWKQLLRNIWCPLFLPLEITVRSSYPSTMVECCEKQDTLLTPANFHLP